MTSGLRSFRCSHSGRPMGDVWIQGSRSAVLGPKNRQYPGHAPGTQEFSHFCGTKSYWQLLRHWLWRYARSDLVLHSNGCLEKPILKHARSSGSWSLFYMKKKRRGKSLDIHPMGTRIEIRIMQDLHSATESCSMLGQLLLERRSALWVRLFIPAIVFCNTFEISWAVEQKDFWEKRRMSCCVKQGGRHPVAVSVVSNPPLMIIRVFVVVDAHCNGYVNGV